MGTFMGFAIGFFIGLFLGSMGMYLLIKQTAADRAIEIAELTKIIETSDDPHQKPFCKVTKAPELDIEDSLEEVKYGEF